MTATAPSIPALPVAAPAPAAPAPAGEERIYVASQWQLVWWKFRKHKLALIGLWVVGICYLIAAFAEIIAPYPTDQQQARYTYAPPTPLRFRDQDGAWRLRPFVYGLQSTVEPRALRRVFADDTTKRYEVHLFVQGAPYKLWNLIPMDRHLFGLTDKEGVILLIGADKVGRDLFSRLVHGARISLTIGLAGVMISFVLGLFFGGLSGFYGGVIDESIQRVIDSIRSIPTIPLWMALAAALPKNWPPLGVYFGITIVLSLIGWTGLARVVRGRFLSLREEDFVMAARLSGSSEPRIIVEHLIPSFASHIIASLTLSIPGVILAETTLSFLGLGLRPPIVSWGVLLQDAQNIRAVAQAPWQLLPGAAVMLVVLALNFLGDGLRDAADPYAR
jgi:peptide/nickel transport system permease protein